MWNEFVDGDYLVKGKDLATGGQFVLDGAGVAELDPVTNGSIVVWRDKRTGDFDLYAFDVETGLQSALLTHPGNQRQVTVGQDYVVWQDDRNSPSGVPPEFGNHDIYALNLATGEEFSVCTAAYDQGGPAISGDIIVWADKRRYIPVITPTFTSDIYGYNVTTGEEFLIAQAAEGAGNSGPDISGNIVVWQDGRNGGDIWGYNLSTDETLPIHVDSPDDYTGQTAQGRWRLRCLDRWARRAGRRYLERNRLRFRREEEFVIFQDAGYVSFPSISGDLVMWTWSPVGEETRIMAAYIPEPASLMLLAGGVTAVVARRRSLTPVRERHGKSGLQ